VATWNDVRELALALPEVEEDSGRGTPSWRVRGKLLAWERPLRRADFEALGDAAPDGPILGAHVSDEGVKFALCAEQPEVYFTTPHFNGYPAVLIRLGEISREELRELITEAWLIKAPKRAVKRYLADQSPAGGPDG
jgi:hypothetical protein